MIDSGDVLWEFEGWRVKSIVLVIELGRRVVPIRARSTVSGPVAGVCQKGVL